MTGDSRRVDRAFVEDALHELNKRATALVAEASLLEESIEDVTGDARRPAKLLIEDVESLRTFLLRLAAFVKTAGAGVEEAGETFDIVEVCRLIASRQAASGSAQIGGADTALVTAPRDSVATAIALLVENALVHGGGSVEVSIVPAGPRVDIEIADRGPGLPEPLESHPFAPFAASRAGLGATGSGLGLALAHALLRSAGATLVYRPGAPGARFAFWLSP